MATLLDPMAAKLQFLAPVVASGSKDLQFQLTVTNSLGLTDQDIVHVTIAGENDVKNAFYFESETGDPIGAGNTGLISNILDNQADFAPWLVSPGSAQMLEGNTVSAPVDPSLFFNTLFSTQPGRQLTPGAYAVTSPSGADSIVVSSSNASCSGQTGLFVVRDVSFDSFGLVNKLAADFIAQCPGASGKLRGALRYKSQLPIVIDKPTASAGASQQTARTGSVTLDGSASFPGWDGDITSYMWKQLSGPPVNIINSGASIAHFNVPASLVTISGNTLKFTLTVTNSLGLSDTASTTVTAIEPSSSSLTLQSDAGDPVGGGVNRSYSTPAANMTLRSLARNAVQVSVTNGLQESWLLGLAAANGQRLSVGSFNGAVRYTGAVQPTPSLHIDSVSRHAFCTTVSGDFDVLDVQYGTAGTIESLAVDFDQTCNGAAGALHGKLRYHSTVP